MVNTSFDLELYDINDLKDIKLGVLYVSDLDILSNFNKTFGMKIDIPILVLPMNETDLEFLDDEQLKLTRDYLTSLLESREKRSLEAAPASC